LGAGACYSEFNLVRRDDNSLGKATGDGDGAYAVDSFDSWYYNGAQGVGQCCYVGVCGRSERKDGEVSGGTEEDYGVLDGVGEPLDVVDGALDFLLQLRLVDSVFGGEHHRGQVGGRGCGDFFDAVEVFQHFGDGNGDLFVDYLGASAW